MGHPFLILCVPRKILLKTGHFEDRNVATLEMRFPSCRALLVLPVVVRVYLGLL